MTTSIQKMRVRFGACFVATLCVVFHLAPAAVLAQHAMPQSSSNWMPQGSQAATISSGLRTAQSTPPQAGIIEAKSAASAGATAGVISSSGDIQPAGVRWARGHEKKRSFTEMICKPFQFGERNAYDYPSEGAVPGESLSPESSDPQAPQADFGFDGQSEDIGSSLETASSTRTLAPNMLGDFIGVAYFGPPPPGDNNAIRFPEQNATLRGITRFKAADNRSPRPLSRLWASFNYFENSYGSAVDIARYTFGAELMLLQGFSAEVLIPINDFENGIPGEQAERYGDMKVVAKGIAFENARTLISWGGALSIPTAKRPRGVPGGIMYFSPFIGYILTSPESRLYVHGFFQFDIPFEDDDQGLFHTDVGVGYWIWRRIGGRVSGIAPTLELHAYNPVFGRPTGQLRGLIYDDTYNVTLGTTANFLQDRLAVSAGVGLPISDRRDYDTEFIIHTNWRF